MSHCDLKILYDRSDRTYRPGETVSGTVEVSVNENVTCKAVKIELCWHTHGRGNTDGAVIDTTEHAGLEWKGGLPYTYPFSFTVPQKPLTYHGHDLNIDHYVKVQVDLPWKLNPMAEEEYILLPGKTSGDDYRAESAKNKEVKVRKPSGGMNVVGWIVGAVIVAILVALLVFWWYMFVVLVIIGAAIKIKNYYVNKRLGNVVAGVDESIVSAGNAVPLRIKFAPTKPIQITMISATLTGQEVCDSGSGTDRTTHRHTVHEEKVVLALDHRAIGSGIPVEFSEKITVPPTNAYSFEAHDNKIVWEITAHIDIPNYPNWQKKFPFTVVPENSR